MKRRCENENDAYFPNYGGRGIKVMYRNFEEFFAEMAPSWKPGLTIDRIDNNGHYQPGNCRWATAKEQARNRINNVLIEFRGEKLCIPEWAERLGFNEWVLRLRLMRYGWSVEDALTTPTAK